MGYKFYAKDDNQLKLIDSSEFEVTAEGSSEARTLKDRFGDIVNVKDFGAKGDGTTDDTSAFESAVTMAKTLRSIVFVPAGSYKLTKTVAGTFYTSGNVTTNYPLNITDISDIRKHNFVHKLEPQFALSIPATVKDGTKYYLQGFTTDNDDTLFYAQQYNNEKQIITKLTLSTGAMTSADFTTLYHANDMTYKDGVLYVACMNDDLTKEIAVINASTLEFVKFISMPNNFSELDYDEYTDRFYAFGQNSVQIYKPDFALEKTISFSIPSWAPAVGQGCCAYKGFLFIPRSSSTASTESAGEAILIYDTYKEKLVGQWYLGVSIGEVETLAIHKGVMLIGCNDGGYHYPFYMADFEGTQTTQAVWPMTRRSLLGTFFGRQAQENFSVYVDASAPPGGDGSTSRPLNSLEGALYIARNTPAHWRFTINATGDFSAGNKVFIKVLFKFVLQQWAGKSMPLLPPIVVYDSNATFISVVFAKSANYNNVSCVFYGEGGFIDLRTSTVTFSGNYFGIYTLRCKTNVSGLAFNGDTSAAYSLVRVDYGDLFLTASISTFTFPDDYKRVRFWVRGNAETQYYDCATSITNDTYSLGKGFYIHTDGTGTGTLT